MIYSNLQICIIYSSLPICIIYLNVLIYIIYSSLVICIFYPQCLRTAGIICRAATASTSGWNICRRYASTRPLSRLFRTRTPPSLIYRKNWKVLTPESVSNYLVFFRCYFISTFPLMLETFLLSTTRI